MTEMIVLEADLDFDCHVFVGEISTYTGLTYVIPVLMHVREVVAATSESLSVALFPGLGPLCQKLLERCREDGTLEKRWDDTYALTEEGHLALESGLAPKRRSGAWKICILHDHPLIPEDARVLRIEDGRREAVYNSKHLSPIPLDDAVEDLIDRIVVPSFGEHERFRIDKADKHQKVFRSSGRVKLLLGVDEGGAQVSIRAPDWKDEDKQVSEPDLTYADVMDSLLQNTRFAWDREARRVQIRYEDTNMEERLAMKKELNLDAHLDNCSFDPFKIKVDIYPRTIDDADLWAQDMFVDGIRDYMTTGKLTELEAKIMEALPECRFGPTKRNQCILGLDPGTSKFWFVHAAEDWGL